MKKSLSVLMMLAFVIVALSAVAFAAEPQEPTAADLKTPPVISNLEIRDGEDNKIWLECTVRTPANVMNAINYFTDQEQDRHQVGFISNLEMQYSLNGHDWIDAGLDYAQDREQPGVNSEDEHWYGIFQTGRLSDIKKNSYVVARVRYAGADASGDAVYSDWSNEIAVNVRKDYTASSWAQQSLAEAADLNLVPSSLKDEDLTKPVTRKEFAAIVIKGYEAMSGKSAVKADNNPFSDTDDSDVLKAYKLGVTGGTSATTFSPDAKLTREQAATMLTRTFKAAKYEGWTPATDGDFSAVFFDSFETPAKFADDAEISDWAKDSVYFLKAKEIMDGIGDNKFAPKASGEEQAAAGYGDTSREQALIMMCRMVAKLK